MFSQDVCDDQVPTNFLKHSAPYEQASAEEKHNFPTSWSGVQDNKLLNNFTNVLKLVRCHHCYSSVPSEIRHNGKETWESGWTTHSAHGVNKLCDYAPVSTSRTHPNTAPCILLVSFTPSVWCHTDTSHGGRLLLVEINYEQFAYYT